MIILTEELLTEILDSKFETHLNHDEKNHINGLVGHKLHKDRTRVIQSDHMKKHGHSVLKLMRKDGVVEYHLHNTKGDFHGHKMDNKSMLHSLKIIHDDAQKHLNHGDKIQLQARTKEQHEHYGKLAHRLIRGHSHKSVKDIGEHQGMDGNTYKTHMIEHTAMSFSEYLWKMREQNEKSSM